MTSLYLIFILAMPQVLGQKPSDITRKIDPKDVTDMVSHIKEAPQTDIITTHALPDDVKDVSVVSDREEALPQIVEIKPLVEPDETHVTIVKPVSKKKNISKLENRRSKWSKKQNNKLKKRNNLRKKQIRKQRLNRRKQWPKKNNLRNNSKRQMRNMMSNKLSKVVDLILSHHGDGNGSKPSTKHIKQQLIDLLKGKGIYKQVRNAFKDCPKPNTNKRKNRNLQRSLKRVKSLKQRPSKKRVVSKGNKSIPVTKDIGSGTKLTNTIEKLLNDEKGVPNAQKGKAKSKVSGRFGRKNRPRKLRRKTNKKSNLKES